MLDLALNPLDAKSLIETFGAAGVFAIIFAETGLLIGFFLPGDSLLFTAGVFCATAVSSTVHLKLGIVLPGAIIAAVLGAQVGYLIGRRAGGMLFDRPKGRLFNPQNLQKAESYFERFGPPRAVVLARFIPIVRTFLNPVAGALDMPIRTFTLWNVVGGVLWAGGLTLLGFVIGDAFPIDRYLLPAVAVIVIVSLLPVLNELRRHRRGRHLP